MKHYHECACGRGAACRNEGCTEPDECGAYPDCMAAPMVDEEQFGGREEAA